MVCGRTRGDGYEGSGHYQRSDRRVRGCNTGDRIISDTLFINAANAAKKNVSRSAPEEATRCVVIEQFDEAHAKTQTPDQQRVVAADFYLGFSILHARAKPAYCKEMNLDLTGFAQDFRATNRQEEYAMDDLLEKKGLKREDIWSRARTPG
jgi:hypothetical protein